ncbi:MAG: 3-deoxy-manno-octulosonate cytidylyltransferase [Pseudomonadota bacterium]
MSFTVVIPARYGSSRLPAKALLDIAGKPMVQHVYERARESNAERVVVATDDQRIVDAVTAFGGEATMSAADHPSGTDRIEEVTRLLNLDKDAVVVNVQGDEPLIPAKVINQVANNLAARPQAGIATLCEPIASADDLDNPNIVKVIANHSGMAYYFSRAPIPWDRDGRAAGGVTEAALSISRRHLGIYAYRVAMLRQFVSWPPSAPEQIESLEQLRALAHGVLIHVADAAAPVPPGVDTQDDLDAVRALLAERQ